MSRPLSLHHINALEVPPLEFIAMAARAGTNQISIFTYSPRNALPDQEAPVTFPLFERSMKPDIDARLADCAVDIVSIEFFPINDGIDIRDYLPALALGRELGAIRAVSHIHDSEPARAVDQLGALCDLAASVDLTIGLEFMGLVPACNSIQKAAWFIDQVGRPNIGIGLDPLHLVRTGGTPGDIAALASRYFTYAQICDGHGLHRSDDYIPDALNREMPGTGDFPLEDMFRALPAATPLEIEIPVEDRAGLAISDYLAKCVARCRSFIDGITPDR